MQITVEIPDYLAAAARARGLHLDRRLAELLTEDLAHEAEALPAPMHFAADSIGTLPTQNLDETERRNAAVDAMLQFASKHRFTTESHDLKSMVHEGHKY